MQDDERSAENWAWEKIRAGEIADFNAEFGKLDPGVPDDWTDERKIERKIGARFLRRIFFEKPYQGEIPIEGARIVGAFLPGGQVLQSGRVNRDVWLDQCRSEKSIDLLSTTFDGFLSLEGSWVGQPADSASLNLLLAQIGTGLNLRSATFTGDVMLADAKIGGHLSMDGSTFEEKLDGGSLQVGQHLMMREATFKGDVIFRSARVGGQLDMRSSIFEKSLAGDSLQVGQSLLMREKATFKGDVILTSAKIDGGLSMDGSTFEKTLNGNSLQVGRYLSMREKATFKGDVILASAKIDGGLAMDGSTFKGDVDLRSVKIDGGLSTDGSTFEKTLDSNNLQVGQNLSMSEKARFEGDVTLRGAKIGGHLSMGSSTFEEKLIGDSLQVGQHLLMHGKATLKGDVTLHSAKIGGLLSVDGSTFEKTLNGSSLQIGEHLFMRDAVFKGAVSLLFARVGGNLDLRGATLAGLDLAGARVTQDLLLAGEEKAAVWSGADLGTSVLRLRNTQVGALQESPGAWPPVTDLEGFSYSRLGGFGATGADDARTRSVKDWKSWLATDGQPGRGYSPQPYAQLASVLVAAGRRDQANAILFAGRQREREEARRHHRWGRWLWLSVLRWLCGYGIGMQTFWVLPWIVGSVLVGTAVLWFCAPVAAHEKGLMWCIGASLDRLLPIIKLSPEFADFFNDPLRKRLTGGVIAFFSGLALWGWVLGSFLVAAVAGLTQRS